ncbi:hypothetical protein ACROYT_G000314 [Oculina patagonica]
MSDGEEEIPKGAEGGLPTETAPKQEAKPLPKASKSASQEESSEIQQLVNTLSQALKQSMVVSSETESRRNVRAPRVYSVGQNFKTWLSQFLQYANLVHIKPSDRRAYLLTLLDQPAYKAVELLKLSGSLTFEEFTAQLIQRFDSGKTKEDYKLQLWARCQRPNEDFEAFADHLMELVENAYPEAAYSFKVELARDQFIQGVAISDDLREKVFMSQPASLVEAVRVVRRLESARKACQAVPSVEKKKSVNVVSASADGDKISTEIRELKEIVLDSGIYISGLVNHSVTCILLDTGATVSVLNEETWRKSGHVSKVNPVTGTLTTANGNELTVLGETKVRFRVGNIDCFWSVMIARGLSHDCILGSDFFQHFGCQIHYDTGTFVVGHTEIPIRYSKVTPSVCRIFLSDDIQVEPGTEQVFEAKLENGYDRNTGSPGILEESKELRGKSEINIARSLVIPRDGLTIVRVANFSDRPIRLRSDFPVAEYHPISSVDGHVVPMEMDPDVTSASHPSCSVIDRPVVKDEEPMKEEKWKSSLQGNLEGLSEDQRGQFLSLVTEYEDIFAKDSSDLGKSGLLEHSIDTGDCKPVKQPPRRVPPYQREVIDQQIDELLATGRVEPSQSPWSSPVVLARKHDGTYRMCIDFRKLNQSTKKDAIPLPRTDDLLEALGGAQWFSSLDLASGYWQMQGSLADHIKTHTALFEGESKKYTKQILEGVSYLHAENIIHRDIKGANVLLDRVGNVKLGDFGLSKIIQKIGSKTDLISHCGTPHWMAPEIIQGKGYGRKADIWSVGCTVVEMLTGRPPLGHLEPVAAIFRIGLKPTVFTLPEGVSEDAKEFIEAALTCMNVESPSALGNLMSILMSKAKATDDLEIHEH